MMCPKTSNTEKRSPDTSSGSTRLPTHRRDKMRSMVSICSIVGLSVSLASCAHTPSADTPSAPPEIRFHSINGDSLSAILAVRYQCYQETTVIRQTTVVNEYGGSSSTSTLPCQSAFLACLAAKGFLADSSGELLVPPSAALNVRGGC